MFVNTGEIVFDLAKEDIDFDDQEFEYIATLPDTICRFEYDIVDDGKDYPYRIEPREDIAAAQVCQFMTRQKTIPVQFAVSMLRKITRQIYWLYDKIIEKQKYDELFYVEGEE